jgi:hypothetical protein
MALVALIYGALVGIIALFADLEVFIAQIFGA